MSETSATRRGRRWLTWAVPATIVLLIAGGIVWGMIAASPVAGPVPSNSGTVVPPQPTEFATPTPGATEAIDKPDAPIEVSVDETAEPAPAIFVEVASLEAVTAGRDIPGERSGPAVKVTLRVVNDSDSPIRTAGAGVNLTYGGDERVPAVALSDDANTAWPATIDPRSTATAVYVFAVPLAAGGDIRVIVDLLASGPDVVFVGPRP